MLGTIKTSTTPALTRTKTCTAQACEQAGKKTGKRVPAWADKKKKEVTNNQKQRHAAFDRKRPTQGRKKNARMLGTIKTSIAPGLTPTKTCTRVRHKLASSKKKRFAFQLGPRSKNKKHQQASYTSCRFRTKTAHKRKKEKCSHAQYHKNIQNASFDTDENMYGTSLRASSKKKRKRVPAWAEKQKKRSKKKGITYNQKLRHAAFDRKRPTQGRKKNDRMLGAIKTSRTPALRRTKTCMARARAHGHMKAVGTPLEIDSL